MTIITISGPLLSHRKEVAEAIAKALNCECLSREILIKDAAEKFGVPEKKLEKAINAGPSMFDKVTHNKEKIIHFFRAALLNRIKNNNVVYHGIAGHYFVQNIPGILKIRLHRGLDQRVEDQVKRNNSHAVRAEKELRLYDKERLKWGSHLYDTDTSDAGLYDMVLNLDSISDRDCTEMILNAVKMDAFTVTEEGQERLAHESLSANIKASIAEQYPDAAVMVNSGKVNISLDRPVFDTEKTRAELCNRVREFHDIGGLCVNLKSCTISRTAMRR